MTPPQHHDDPAPAPDTPPGELVPASNRDRPINLDFEAYRPVRPLADKVRAENLLWHSLIHGGCLETWDDPLHALQRSFGRDRMVWGMHLEPGGDPTSWEVRVLNRGPHAEGSEGVLGHVRELLAPWLALAPGLSLAGTPYEILGLRIGKALALPAVEIYQRGHEQSRKFVVSRVNADARTPLAREMVCEPKREVDDYLPFLEEMLVSKLGCEKHRLGRVLIPELFACRRMHVAVRENARLAITFSGVNAEQLLFTYKRFELPKPMLEFFSEQRERLEHLLWDVDVEFGVEDTRIIYPKVAIFGCL